MAHGSSSPATLARPVTGVDPTAARFPALPDGAGHYESFYLKACHPSQPLGRLDPVHGARAARRRADRVAVVHAVRRDGRRRTQADGGRADGRARASGSGSASRRSGTASPRAASTSAAWDLRFTSPEPPLFHLPREWMYTRAAAAHEAAEPGAGGASSRGRSRSAIGRWSCDGWRGMVGHNWGAQHAERWIWLHGIAADRATGSTPRSAG